MFIKTFLDEDYTAYAVYRIYQRLPHIIDTLGQTQRKILFTLADYPESKKFKTAEVYSKVYDNTSYLHGDMSIYNVVENMAKPYGNNINVLTTEGDFGNRTSRGAAAPRYTSTRFSQAARTIFKKEDNPILTEQEFEGKLIEPKFMLPILPISLVNGYNAIAVGFASKFLPRNPIDIIEQMQTALKYRKRKNSNWDNYKIDDIPPSYPFYTGTIIHDKEHVDNSAWILTGKLHKSKKRNIIEVTDVPPEISREGYIKKLKRFQEKGLIRDYSESCVKNNFKFTIKVSPELWKKSEEDLLELLGLTDRVVENFTFLNPEGDHKNTVVKFDSSGEYLKHFIHLRQGYYEIRKEYQLEKLRKEILILEEKVKFIEAVNNEEITIVKRKKKDLEKELKELGYEKIEDSYDYLLGMKMYVLTQENIDRFLNNIKDRKKELQVLEKTPIEDIHIKELEELKKILTPELQKKGLSY